ncbi:MAG: hypothetical protein HYT71_03540 [Candidatus Aenigmarchaeota archaeon]|nr:hypothetical protein [Candidatus Aenigmarchaeota archaeon]
MKLDLGELSRKAVHISGVLAVPLLYALGRTKTAFLFFFLAALLYIYPSVVESTKKTFLGGFLRSFRSALDFFEQSRKRRYAGAINFLAGIGLTIFIFPEKIASISIIALCIGDGVSTLVGRYFGKNRLFHNESKSWEGSLSGLIASVIVCLSITSLPVALFGSFVGMLTESLDLGVDDNLSVPFAVGVSVYLVSYAGLLAV